MKETKVPQVTENNKQTVSSWFNEYSIDDSYINYDSIEKYNRVGRIKGGGTKNYDIATAKQFCTLTELGLRQNHYLLDIGCGSLRGGRLFISYLLPERYYGIEPHIGLMQSGIENDIGKSLIQIKRPILSNDDGFCLSQFSMSFDFLLAQSIFSHATKKQVDKCLSEASKVMKKESIFAATFPPGDVDYKGDEWIVGRGIRYKIETMEELADKNGLRLSKLDVKHHNWNDELPDGDYNQGQIWVKFQLK